MEPPTTATTPSSGDDLRRLESLIAQVLAQRPGVSRDSLLKLIQEKKSRVGGGYLTDQGSLFLVASDLGVTMNYRRATCTKLADLNPELQNITVEARVLGWSPPRVFTRKNDSKQGIRAKMIIYDETATTAVNLWDAKSSFPLEGAGLRPGDPIRISNVYARAGPDGSLSISAGEKASLEKLQSFEGTDLASIPTPERRAIPPELVLEPARHLVLKGKVSGVADIRKSSFTRPDGSQGSLVSFSVRSLTQKGVTMRVVIWDNPNPVFLGLREDEEVTICNLRAKPQQQQNSPTTTTSSSSYFPGIELHGDDTSAVLEYWVETFHWIKSNAPDVSGVLAGSLSSLSATGKKSSQASTPTPFVARILSVGEIKHDGSSAIRLLVTDSSKRKISVSLTGEAAQGIVEGGPLIAVDDVIVCKPDSIDYLAQRASCSKRGSLVKTAAQRPDIPDSSKLIASIEKLEEGGVASLEVMSLAESVSREVQTKDGLVRRSELLVGDPTGEIRVYAWRDLSKLLEKIPAGERLWLRAVEAQTHEGKKFLVVKNYSRVELRAKSGK